MRSSWFEGRRRLVGLAAVLVCVLGGGVPAAQAGLIGLYTFEGNIDDVSGSGDHGTFGPTAPTLTASGYEGSAYQFGADANTYITVPIDINPGVFPALTMGAWVNADVADAVIRGIISHDDGGFDRLLGVDTRNCAVDPCWSAFRSGTVLSSNITVVPGQWVFLAVRYDAAAPSTILNVDAAQFVAADHPGSSSRTVATIGRNPGFDLPFKGRIDNVFFFDSVLSDAQMAQILSGGKDAILAIGGAAGAEIPEPGTVVFLGGGLVVLAALRRRRRMSLRP